MVISSYKHRLAPWLAWPVQLCVACRLSPNAITCLGFVGVAASCMYYVVTRRTLSFCVLVLGCGLFDALDGAVARLTGRTSRWGSYLDAMVDRYTDTIVCVTVAWVTGYWLLVSAAWSGAMLVSYAKARAALEVPVSNTEWPDVMERTERSICFLGGLAASAIVPWRWAGRDVFWWSLFPLAIAIHATALQRMWRARRLILSRSPQHHY